MAVNNPDWVTRTFSEDKHHLPRTVVDDHPLKMLTVTERIPRKILYSQSSTGRTTPVSTPTSLMDISLALEGVDPLTKFAIEELDPLTQIANENAKKVLNNQNTIKKKQKNEYEFETWESRKIGILKQFTTSEKITIVSSFLHDGEKHVIIKAQSNSIDKVQHRLEQLDYFEEGSQKKFDLSQVEYVRRIGELNKELVLAWNSEQRVKALKIAIQCAKMLSDTDVLQFYPSKFVLITDILDVFGKLVYERLRTKANYMKPGSRTATALPEDFTPDMVPEPAKETCRNWFYKIASIRELVPRIYVEMAILKSYSFLTSSEYSNALMRLTRMIRGIGNPLVSLYARGYLCRVGMTVADPKTSAYLIENFYDFLSLYNHIYTRSVKQELAKHKMNYPNYLTLYMPALEFILQAIVSNANEVLLSQIVERIQQEENRSLLLNTIMAVYKPNYISERSLQFFEMIINSSDESFPKHILLHTLGLCVNTCPPYGDQKKLLLTNVWQVISKLRNIDEYIFCAEPWVQYAVQYFINREGEINVIFGDIIQHMANVRDKFHLQLKSTIEKIILNTQDIGALIAMNNFLPLIELLHQETAKVEICKTILVACNNEQSISDPVIINNVIFLCCILHDSVSALTIEDETRQISDIICGIVQKVDYGRDFEQQLTFYVEARGAFCNLYSVLGQLVQCVNLLSIRTRTVVGGHHTRKTGAFVRACAAYSFITIPSIISIHTQLELYLLSGQVALFNNCLGQADSFFKTALKIMPELTNIEESSRVNDGFLVAFTRKFLSVLLVTPDSPDKGVLSLTRILLNNIQHFEWYHICNLCELYINVLDMLSVMSQEKFPYYIDKVECNDSLYGSDPKFLSEINKICNIILTELLNKLKEIGTTRQQSNLSLKLLFVLVNRTEIDYAMGTLCYNLWLLANKNVQNDIKFSNRLKNSVIRKSKNIDNKILQQVVIKMQSTS